MTITPFVTTIVVLFLAAPLAAQTGSIAGNIRDSSGAVMPSIEVVLTQTETGFVRQTATDANGFYLFPLLPVGTYALTVNAQGFRRYERTGFAISVNQQATLDIALQIGDIAETVKVTAEAPLLNMRSSEVGALMDPVRLTELPLNGRNPLELAGLLPGVQGVAAPDFAIDTNSGPRISVDGSRGSQNLVLFDGSNHSFHFRNVSGMLPSPDTLQEFKVTTNLFSAEYGSAGGAVLNAITRSGSNEYHGNLYEFLRNDNLNARDSFLPRKTNLEQNQFGVTGGGPLLRSRLFYFGALEFLRTRPEAAATNAFPPTAAERVGNFAGRTITDPLTRAPFAGGQIPVSRFDKVAKNVLDQYLPLPNQSDGRFINSASAPTNVYQLTLKLDFQLNSKHTFFNRFFRGDTVQQSPLAESNIAGYSPGVQQIEIPANNVFGWTSILSQKAVNEFRMSFFYSDNPFVNFNRKTFAELGGIYPDLPGQAKFPPGFNVAGKFTLVPQAEQTRREEQYEIYDNLSWQRANHSLKFGFRWHRGFSAFRGTFHREYFTFDRSITGDAVADFLLGRPATMGLINPGFFRDTLGDQFGFYVQDDWRVTPQLTINLGLRYEVQLPWIEKRGWWSTMYKNSGFQSKRYPTAPVDMAFYGDPGVPPGMIDPDLNNFQPRIGFAYSPTKLRRTVFRGGFGLFNDLNNADIIQNTGQPFQLNQTYFAIEQLSDPLRGLGGVPLPPDVNNPVFKAPFSIAYPSRDYRNGYVMHYNFVVQHEVTNNFSIELGYVGKQSRKLTRSAETNPAIFGPGATAGNIESRRPFRPGLYSSLIEYSTTANASYNALQAQVIRRLTRGFSIQGSYTFSKIIDNGSMLVIGSQLPNPLDWRSQRGLSDVDAKHFGNVSFVFEIPKSGNRVVHKVFLNGWQTSGILSGSTGNPLTVFSGRDVALSGTANQTANVVGNPDRAHASKADATALWFNTAAFAAPATGQYGNMARNNFRGPGRWNLTTGIFRNFPIRERFRLQFRSEFFNFLNHTNLNNPVVQMNNASFGRILNGSAPRVIQFALKLYY